SADLLTGWQAAGAGPGWPHRSARWRGLPDGRTLAAIGNDNDVRLWKLADLPEPRRALIGEPDERRPAPRARPVLRGADRAVMRPVDPAPPPTTPTAVVGAGCRRRRSDRPRPLRSRRGRPGQAGLVGCAG